MTILLQFPEENILFDHLQTHPMAQKGFLKSKKIIRILATAFAEIELSLNLFEIRLMMTIFQLTDPPYSVEKILPIFEKTLVALRDCAGVERSKKFLKSRL